MPEKKKRRKMSFTTVGGSSILTIFAVLCFVVFALLSLSTAKADSVLTEKATKATTNYYQADVKAEEILARLRQGETPVGVDIEREENGILSTSTGDTEGYDKLATYSEPIDDKQQLQVEVLLKDDGSYKIIRWNKVYIAEWEIDDSLPVYQGDNSDDDIIPSDGDDDDGLSGDGGLITLDD